MVGNQQITLPAIRKLWGINECQTKRGRMGRNVEDRRFGIVTGVLEVLTFIEIRVMYFSPITDWPTIILAFFDNVYFVRRQIVSQEIPTHFSDPRSLCLRIDGNKYRISQTFCNNLRI